MSFRIRRVKWREVLQSCAITKLILILSLNHGRPRNRKLNEILELLYIKKKTIIITASNLIENTTNYSPRYPFRPEFWWEFSKNFSAIFFFVPKKCFESVFLSLISKTNTALVWRFFFGKIARNGSRFTRRKWNYYLWVRRARTDWKTSTTPSYCIRSKTMLSVMKTPVRPTPALQWTVIGPSWPNCSLVLWTCPMKSMKASPDLGTPEKANRILIKSRWKSFACPRKTWKDCKYGI